MKTVFFGSSTIQGHGATTPSSRFTTLVSSALGWEEVNLGIGGSTVTGRDVDGFLVAPDSAVARVPDVAEHAPDAVFVLYGSNDFAASVPLGSKEVFQPGTFYWELDAVLRGLMLAIEPQKILLSTLPYRGDADMPNSAGAVLADYNAVIRHLAAQYGAFLMQPDAGSGIDQRSFKEVAADDVHFNDLGHQRLAAYYIQCLATCGAAC